MDISSLHTQLKTKQLTDFYIFTGVEWMVQKLYIEQQALTDHYLAEYRKAKSESSKNIQQKAFLKAKYTEAIVKKYGLKPDTIRKKFKSIQNVLTEIGAQFKLNK